MINKLTKQDVDTDPFIIKGSHTCISACTLPTWLPTDIVDSMNQEFRSVLREELITLMKRSRLELLKCVDSNGSGESSLGGSDEEVDAALQLNENFFKFKFTGFPRAKQSDDTRH